jgi:alkylhydroperoxidase family enzyme
LRAFPALPFGVHQRPPARGDAQGKILRRAFERSRMAEAPDGLRCGVVLTNARGAILHANDAAEAMLSNGDAVQGSGGVLRAKSRSAAAELREAIALAAQDEAGCKTGLAIRLTEADEPAVLAHVLPLTGGDLRTRLQPEAVAAVFIGTPPEEQDVAAATASAYGLTPAVPPRLHDGETRQPEVTISAKMPGRHDQSGA